MPNAKLRQMYSAMVRLRLLGDRLGQLEKRTKSAGVRGLEACFVSTTVDLGPEDLVSDAFQSRAFDFLRGMAAEEVLRPDRRLRAAGTLANCGAGTRLTAPAAGQERLWAAVGAASSLKANSQQTSATDGGVLVCYMRSGDAQTAAWAKALAYVSANKLPLLFVVLPVVVLPGGKSQASRTGQMCALALRQRIPGMAVDQHDAVALYRVAQEAIGHARIGGGGALIECVRYVVEGTKAAMPDAISGLGQYMLQRRVADARWMDREANSFRKRIDR
jgi:pyruvate dehydrogenase E1 component alpha subunit